MEMGIVVTAFYLFGMLGLVVLDAALEEPTQDNQAKPKPRARTARVSAEIRTDKKAA